MNRNLKDYNFGFAILRTFMCFMVLLYHFWDDSNATGALRFFVWAKNFAVPVFMTMTFILVQPTFINHSKDKMLCRLERLAIPQIGWAVIYWVVYFILGIEPGLKITAMIWQMLFGHSPLLNPTMWYQIDLIYLTLLFWGIVVLCRDRKRTEIALISLCMLALFAQYSGANMVFQNLRYELQYPLGRFMEMLPMAVVGFMLSSKNILERLKRSRLATAIAAISIIAIDGIYPLFSGVQGYAYAGIEAVLMGAIFCILFYVIPFEHMGDRYKRILLLLTRYTMGIYCMHRLVAKVLGRVLQHFGLKDITTTFYGCIILYILCYGCAYVGTKIVRGTKLKALFE